MDAIPPHWMDELKARRKIFEVLLKIDQGHGF
jgi:hypothetical protein